MTWVKVCGLRTMADVGAAVDAGADAVGFVAVPSSPRFIPPEAAAELAAGVPVQTILLTINLTPQEALSTLGETGITGLQPYGEHARAAAEAAHDAGHFVLFPQHAKPGIELETAPGISLVDTPSATQRGGTGRTFDWAIVADLDGDFVLAGGLGPDNVAAAIQEVAPWGVDASSGLERAPGVKDHGMVADFITEAKRT